MGVCLNLDAIHSLGLYIPNSEHDLEELYHGLIVNFSRANKSSYCCSYFDPVRSMLVRPRLYSYHRENQVVVLHVHLLENQGYGHGYHNDEAAEDRLGEEEDRSNAEEEEEDDDEPFG